MQNRSRQDRRRRGDGRHSDRGRDDQRQIDDACHRGRRNADRNGNGQGSWLPKRRATGRYPDRPASRRWTSTRKRCSTGQRSRRTATELTVKTNVVSDDFSVKLTPKNIGAIGIKIRRSHVSFRPGSSEEEGSYVDLTFKVLAAPTGSFTRKFRVQGPQTGPRKQGHNIARCDQAERRPLRLEEKPQSGGLAEWLNAPHR